MKTRENTQQQNSVFFSILHQKTQQAITFVMNY